MVDFSKFLPGEGESVEDFLGKNLPEDNRLNIVVTPSSANDVIENLYGKAGISEADREAVKKTAGKDYAAANKGRGIFAETSNSPAGRNRLAASASSMGLPEDTFSPAKMPATRKMGIRRPQVQFSKVTTDELGQVEGGERFKEARVPVTQPWIGSGWDYKSGTVPNPMSATPDLVHFEDSFNHLQNMEEHVNNHAKQNGIAPESMDTVHGLIRSAYEHLGNAMTEHLSGRVVPSEMKSPYTGKTETSVGSRAHLDDMVKAAETAEAHMKYLSPSYNGTHSSFLSILRNNYKTNVPQPDTEAVMQDVLRGRKFLTETPRQGRDEFEGPEAPKPALVPIKRPAGWWKPTPGSTTPHLGPLVGVNSLGKAPRLEDIKPREMPTPTQGYLDKQAAEAADREAKAKARDAELMKPVMSFRTQKEADSWSKSREDELDAQRAKVREENLNDPYAQKRTAMQDNMYRKNPPPRKPEEQARFDALKQKEARDAELQASFKEKRSREYDSVTARTVQGHLDRGDLVAAAYAHASAYTSTGKVTKAVMKRVQTKPAEYLAEKGYDVATTPRTPTTIPPRATNAAPAPFSTSSRKKKLEDAFSAIDSLSAQISATTPAHKQTESEGFVPPTPEAQAEYERKLRESDAVNRARGR